MYAETDQQMSGVGEALQMIVQRAMLVAPTPSCRFGLKRNVS